METPVGELADDLLADEDREYLDEGFYIHIKLTVDDITASVAPAKVSAVPSAAPGLGGVPDTGDDTPVALYAMVLLISLSGVFALAIVRKCRKRDGAASRNN